MTPNDEQSCANCFFAREENEEIGSIECHRNPPTATFRETFFTKRHGLQVFPEFESGDYTMDELKTEFDDWRRWPVCSLSDWCGEWKPMQL